MLADSPLSLLFLFLSSSPLPLVFSSSSLHLLSLSPLYLSSSAFLSSPPRYPTAIGYGAAAGLAGVYFTDAWIGRNVLRFVPWIGDGARAAIAKEQK